MSCQTHQDISKEQFSQYTKVCADYATLNRALKAG